MTGPASGAAGTKWTFARQTDSSYTLTNGDSGPVRRRQRRRHDGRDGGDPVDVLRRASNQRWTATQLPSGLWTLKNNHTGLLMTSPSGTNGALVTQEADTGAALQEWTLS